MSIYPPAPHFCSLPTELSLEIISHLLQSHSDNKSMSFSSRMKTLATLSLTAPFLRALVISSPTFWSEVEIDVIRDVACSPPLSFLEQLFARSGETMATVKLVHWGEEREDHNAQGGWEWLPGVTREIRKLFDNNQRRIQTLCLEFHHLNGTEYSTRGGMKEGKWEALEGLEIYAYDWVTVHSLPMGWLESVISSASPKVVTIRGNGAFAWSTLARDMSHIKILRVDTEIAESLALEIMSRVPMAEECRFGRIIRASQVVGSGTIKLSTLRKLHVGFWKGAGNFLDMVTTPELQTLGVEVYGRSD